MACSLELFGNMIKDLEREGLDYRVVGGIARRAFTDEQIPALLHDVDIVFCDKVKFSIPL
mgnify:FL=1